jgi:NADPH-dependent 2,4-dienoyl-CoA reductase/sulfur reductase-like enzyme
MSESLIVIGNGMAAARFVEELTKRTLGRYAVAVIGEEPRLAYNRVLLSALLAEEVGVSDIELKPAQWWRDRDVTLKYGVKATAVDPVARKVGAAPNSEPVPRWCCPPVTAKPCNSISTKSQPSQPVVHTRSSCSIKLAQHSTCLPCVAS